MPQGGCTSSLSLNFAADAVVDDGSCIIGGCLDSTSVEFDSTATYSDGSCPIPVLGCTAVGAENYWNLATKDDGSCLFVGCTDSSAVDFDATASIAAACTYATFGCTASSAVNFLPSANRGHPKLCLYLGCTDSTRSNFDALANIDSGLCDSLFPGCTDPSAENYNAVYTVNDGSCTVPGCTDSTSPYYEPAATFSTGCNGRRSLDDDVARRQLAAGCMNPAASNQDVTVTSHDPSACQFLIQGCSDSRALNYLPVAQENDWCILPIYGCTLETALNYDSIANVLDECVYPVMGCTDSAAANYNSASNLDDGSCIYYTFGCTARPALNYDSTASVSDGTCDFPIVGCTDSMAANYIAAADTLCGSLPHTAHLANCCSYPIYGCMSIFAQNFESIATIDDGSCIVLSPSPPPPSPPQPAPKNGGCNPAPDFDGDGHFRLLDASFVASVWAGLATWRNEAPCRGADFDDDGHFRLLDASFVASVWAGLQTFSNSPSRRSLQAVAPLYGTIVGITSGQTMVVYAYLSHSRVINVATGGNGLDWKGVEVSFGNVANGQIVSVVAEHSLSALINQHASAVGVTDLTGSGNSYPTGKAMTITFAPGVNMADVYIDFAHPATAIGSSTGTLTWMDTPGVATLLQDALFNLYVFPGSGNVASVEVGLVSPRSTSGLVVSSSVSGVSSIQGADFFGLARLDGSGTALPGGTVLASANRVIDFNPGHEKTFVGVHSGAANFSYLVFVVGQTLFNPCSACTDKMLNPSNANSNRPLSGLLCIGGDGSQTYQAGGATPYQSETECYSDEAEPRRCVVALSEGTYSYGDNHRSPVYSTCFGALPSPLPPASPPTSASPQPLPAPPPTPSPAAVVRTAAVSAPSPPPPMSPRPSPPTQSPAAPRALTFSEDPAQITMLSLSAVGWLVLIVASLSCWTCYRKRIRARAKMEAKASQQDRQEEQATAAAGQLAPPNAGVALPHPQRLPAPLEGQADAASAIATSAPREVAPGDDTPGDDTPADDASCVDSSGALPFAEAAVSASEATTPALSPRLTPRAALVSGGYVRV